MHRYGWIFLLLIGLCWPVTGQEKRRPAAPAPASPAEAEPSETTLSPASGTVTLSLDRFLALTRKKVHKAASAGETAPVPYLFNQGEFRLTAQDKWVRVEGDLNLQIFSTGWVEVPLLAENVVLEEARLDNAALMVHSKDGKNCALISGAGNRRLRLTYYLPISTSGPTRSFAFQAPTSAVTTMRLMVPGQDVKLTSQPRIPLRSHQKGSQTVVEGALPASNEGSQVTFSWIPLAAHPALRGKPTREKPRVYARLYTLATVSERDVRCVSRVDLSILRNELKTLTLNLPAGVEVLDVQSAKMERWGANDGASGRQVEVRFSEGVSGTHSLRVTYEQPLESAPKGHFAVPTLQISGAERIKGSVGVQATGGVEVQHSGLQEARAVDIQELPAEVSEMTTAPVTLAYEYHKQPFQISLETHKGEEIPLLPAVVDRADALTLITEEGKLISTFTYTMRNNRKQFLQFEPPPKATVYCAFVDGKAVKQVEGEKGQVRLPLVSPPGTFPVEVTYVQELAGAVIVGTDALVAPKIDVPVCGLSWSVYLPGDHTIFSTEGSAQRGPLTSATTSAAPSKDSAPPAAPAPQRARAQAPQASAANRPVEALKNEVAGEAMEKKTSAQAVDKEDYFRDDNRMAQMVQTVSQGAFPVRVEIPRSGQLLQFSQLIVTPDEAPRVLLHYYSKSLAWLLWCAILVLGMALGAATARGRSGWKVPVAGWVLAMLFGSYLGSNKSALQLALLFTMVLWLWRTWGSYLIDSWKLRRAAAAVLALLWALALNPPPALATPAPDSASGTVSIPLAEFLKILQNGPAGSPGGAPQAPSPWLLSRGDYRVNAVGAWAEVEGRLDLSILRSGWQEVDLLPAEVVLKQVRLDGKPVSVYLKEGRYRCLTRGVGAHKLTLAYHLPINEKSFALSTPPTRVSKLQLVTGAGMRLRATPEIPLTSRPVGGKTVAEGAMPGGQAITFSWSPVSAAAHQTKGGKPLLAARVFSLATISDNVVRSKHRVDYQILRNELETLTLTIPAGSEVVELTCPNLAGWTTTDQGKVRQVTAALSQPATGNLSVNLTVETPITQIDSTWDLPSLGVPGVERMKGSLGIEAGSGIEVTPVAAGLEVARPVDVRELPAEVTQMTGKPVVLAYEYHRQPFRVAVETRKGREITSITATIDKAQGTTLITPEGKQVTRLVYNVRNNHQQHLEVEMPAGSTIWSTFVNGKAVKPVKAEEGKVRVPLETSTSADGQMSTFPIEIVYAQGISLRAWLDTLHLITPKVDMPISELSWSVYLPSDWEVLRQGGNLKPFSGAAPASPPPVASAPRRAKPSAEAPSADGGSLSQAPSAQARMQNIVRETDQGLLPVQVSLPLPGRPLHFQRLMVTKDASVLELTISSRSSQAWFGWMLAGLALAVGAVLARRPRGWLAIALAMALLWVIEAAAPAVLLPLLVHVWTALELSVGLWLLIHLETLPSRLPRWCIPTLSLPTWNKPTPASSTERETVDPEGSPKSTVPEG